MYTIPKHVYYVHRKIIGLGSVLTKFPPYIMQEKNVEYKPNYIVLLFYKRFGHICCIQSNSCNLFGCKR